MKIAIYGGTFNPPHNGHASVIRLVSEVIRPDRFFVIPAFLPPHKTVAPNSPTADERMKLCRLAFGDIPGVELSDIELSRGDTSYTYTTLTAIREEYPEDELYLVMGTDQLLWFRNWYRFRDILEMATLVAVSREENDLEALEAQAESLRNEFGARVILTANKPLVISSEEIRKAVNGELPEERKTDCLSPAVLAEIRRKGFYCADRKPVSIRPAREDDYPFILQTNRDNVEVLSPMDGERLRLLAGMAALFLVAEANGERVAFLLAMDESSEAYDSENYRWFKRNYDRFLYVDRVVIAEPRRGCGIGKALYRETFRHAKANGYPVVTAEIDTVPYNGVSLQFHEKMGFREVGTQSVRGGSVTVSLREARV